MSFRTAGGTALTIPETQSLRTQQEPSSFNAPRLTRLCYIRDGGKGPWSTYLQGHGRILCAPASRRVPRLASYMRSVRRDSPGYRSKNHKNYFFHDPLTFAAPLRTASFTRIIRFSSMCLSSMTDPFGKRTENRASWTLSKLRALAAIEVHQHRLMGVVAGSTR